MENQYGSIAAWQSWQHNKKSSSNGKNVPAKNKTIALPQIAAEELFNAVFFLIPKVPGTLEA
jgi:hypothetical protein